jgi:type IX secretion system PorP/SprF family membrane protein
MKKLAIFLIVIFQFAFSSHGQDVFFTQYLPNPYIINPAYAGYEGRSTFALTHRRQWTGIDDAPVTTNFNYHVPFLSGLNLGVNVTQDQGGIFKNTSGLITAGYSLQMGWYHFLSFGLSFGGGNTLIDFSEGVNINDPALSGILESSAYLDGNLGLAYHFHGFNIGVTLPSLFTRQFYNTEYLPQGEFEALRQYIINVDYMLYFSDGQNAFQPYLLYRSFPEYAPQIEAGAVFHINNLLWIGGIFRSDFDDSAIMPPKANTLSGLLGFKIQNLSIGYAYDYNYGSNNISFINQSTHEIQLTYTIGLKSAWADQYSTFLSSTKPDRPKREQPPQKEQNPRFIKGPKYLPD